MFLRLFVSTSGSGGSSVGQSWSTGARSSTEQHFARCSAFVPPVRACGGKVRHPTAAPPPPASEPAARAATCAASSPAKPTPVWAVRGRSAAPV